MAACVPIEGYHPYVGDIENQAILDKDEADCASYAKAYSTPLDVDAISSAAVQGGARNASGAALNALVPVLGAAGGASSELLSEVGLLNDDKRKVFLRCLDHRGVKSGAYNVMDPNE